MQLIPCFDHIPKLKDKFSGLVKDGMTEEEQREVGKKIALDYHKQLHTELNSFKKGVGAATPKYEAPDFSKATKEINDRYDSIKSNTEKDAIQVGSSETPAVDEAPGSSKEMGGRESGSKEPPISPPEKEKPSDSDENPVGISHEALTATAKRLGFSEPERGTIPPVEDLLDRGRKLVDAGVDPEEVGRQFMKDNKISMNTLAVARAHEVDLVKAADDAYFRSGAKSKEYADAVKNLERWNTDVVKPMGTEWGGAGQVLNGLPVDQGSPTAMKEGFSDLHGKPPTPEQAQKIDEMAKTIRTQESKITELTKKLSDAIDNAVGSKENFTQKAKRAADSFRKLKTTPFTFKDENGNDITPTTMGVTWNDAVELGAKIIEKTGEIADGVTEVLKNIKDADWYKKLSDSDKEKFATQLQQHYEGQKEPEEKDDDLHTRFVGKKDSNFSPNDARDIWNYAKETYLKKGSTFPDMISKTGVDLGLDQEQVYRAIVSPKTKAISDELWLERRKNAVAKQNAQAWVKNAETGPIKKAWKFLPSAFFNLATWGHGTVGPITHAGMNIFAPQDWAAYWPNAFKGFEMAYGNEAKYQRTMDQFVRQPNYAFWLRHGVAIDPKERYDDYQFQEQDEPNALQKLFHKLNTAGDKGFNALKLMRYDLAELHWNRLSDAVKSDPKMPKMIAEMVNNATGTTTTVKVPGWVSVAAFAPKLEVSRWKRFAEPVKALNMFNPKASPADRAMATIYAKRAGQMVGSYYISLLANQGLLTAFGSKQQINFTDPTKSDFLKFKVADKEVDVSGGMLSTLRFAARLWHDSRDPQKKKGSNDREENVFKHTGQYLRGKLSPAAGTALDIPIQHDFEGRPFPWSNDKPPKGKTPITPLEYVSEKIPIPLSEGAKVMYEKSREDGMNVITAQHVYDALGTSVFSGATGARISPDRFQDKDKDSGPSTLDSFRKK